MPKIPVVFLTFANDRVSDVAYLRNLPIELDGIRKNLYKAQQVGLCEVVERANAVAGFRSGYPYFLADRNPPIALLG